MSPDKKPTGSSTGGGDQSQECSESNTMEDSSGLTPPSTSDVTKTSHGANVNIPSITASQPTLKCSINDQMKTFDPGEESGIERLTNNHSGNSSCSGKNSSNSVMKNSTKNYKAGSKINKLADMLAKRSQNMVEVTQNDASDIITDITSVPKVEDDTVILNNVSNVEKFENSLNEPVSFSRKTGDENELKSYKKCRRKSVPDSSSNLQEMQLQSTSKSCSDITEIFPSKENGGLESNALGGDLSKLQTDESTKKKPNRKNLKNVELPLILPERKRRSSARNENLSNSKIVEKSLGISSESPAAEVSKSKESPNEIIPSSIKSPNCSPSRKRIKKEKRMKLKVKSGSRKSKRLVENSTQTTDIEFLSIIKPNKEPVTEEPSYECLYCTEIFTYGTDCKAHEKTHSEKGVRDFIKCQYCTKKLNSLEELKSHCVRKHPNKYSYCMKCDERFATKQKLYSHNREIHLSKNIDSNSQNSKKAEIIKKALQRVKDREDGDKGSEKTSNQEHDPKEDDEDDEENSEKSFGKVCSRNENSPKSSQEFDINEKLDSKDDNKQSNPKEDVKIDSNKQKCSKSDQTGEDKQNSQEWNLEVDDGNTPKRNGPKIYQKTDNKPDLPNSDERVDNKQNSPEVDLKIDKSEEKSSQVGQKIDNKQNSTKSDEKFEKKQNNSNSNIDTRTETSPKVDQRMTNRQSDSKGDIKIDSSKQDNQNSSQTGGSKPTSGKVNEKIVAIKHIRVKPDEKIDIKQNNSKMDMKIDSSKHDSLNSDYAVENKQTRSKICEKIASTKHISVKLYEKVDSKQNNSKIDVINDNRKEDGLNSDQAVENRQGNQEMNEERDTAKHISPKSDEKVCNKPKSSKLEQNMDSKLNDSKVCHKIDSKPNSSKINQTVDDKQQKLDIDNRQNISKVDCRTENKQASSKVCQIMDNKQHNSKVDVKIQNSKQIPEKIDSRNTPKPKSLKLNQKADNKQVNSKVEPKIEGRQNIPKVDFKVDNKQATSKGNEKIDSNKQYSSKSDHKLDSKQNNPKVDFKAVNKQSCSKIEQRIDYNKQSVSKVDQKIDNSKQSCPKADLKVDVSYENTKKSSVSPRNVQKFSPKESKTEEQLLEMEMLFYSHLSGNIQENLTNHLDGKIDQSGNPVRTDQVVETTDVVQAKTKSSNLLSVVTPSAGVPDVQVSRAPSPYQTRSKTPNPLPPTAKKFKKLPNWQQKFWEKYNFPTNYRYEHRFWDKNYLNTDKSAFYLKDLSCLDIKTQLTMRENIKKLDSIKKIEEGSKAVNKLKFPDYLSLVPRANNGDGEESVSESQKNKKQVRKEEVKKSFKTPGSELPLVKSRRKLSSDNTAALKRQSDRVVMEGLKMVTRRQSSLELLKDDKEESSRKRKGSLDSSEGQRMILRRQASLDNLGSSATVSAAEKNDQILELNTSKTDAENSPLSPTGSAEISGEWVRPRSYLCGTCCTKFTNLWELEDHKWVSHPNVWCTHYEFEDEKIDKLFQKNEDETTEADSSESSVLSKSKLTDLYKRYLLPHGSLKTAKLVPKTNFPEQCTKCKKNCMNSSEMHKHMLDCGGDTTWFLTMYSSPMTIKRKWRPFGSRRRKQIGRRDVKRNIPSTPTLRSYHYQHRIRTKPGDVETIQKMLANLPEKRARRAINFDEIKTRSQATIHSNRLLRKRFKSSFSNNFLKFKTMKQKRPPIKQGRKESSSKSTTDTSSESTPIGSPKRRNKLKENLQLLKEENSRDGSSETSDAEQKSAKKKTPNKKKEPTRAGQQEAAKVKSKTKKGKQEGVKEKLPARGNGSANKSKRKTPLVKEEPFDEIEGSDAPTDGKEKIGKNAKKRSNNKSVESAVKEEVSETVDISGTKLKETPTKLGKKLKVQTEDPMEGTSKKKYQWASTPSNQILRLNQRSKEKTELIKRIQKKFKNSKRILELKEAKINDCGNRRSLRIKSLQQGEDGSEFLNGQVPEDTQRAETNADEETRVKIPVLNLENTPVKKPQKSPTAKNSKSAEQKTEKEYSDKEGSATISRRSSRSLRNSISSEEKPEVVLISDSNVGSHNSRSLLRRNSKNLLEINEPSLPDIVIEDVIISKKSLRVQSERCLKSEGREKADAPKGQISLLKKNRLPSKSPARGEIKLEETPEEKSDILNTQNDLAEMPILAKVEPIRSKISRKNEKEIPVLMPVEEEQNGDSEEEISPGKDSISFQVIKKRRKTSKEVTPLKIVKKVESVNPEEVSRCFQVDREDYDLEESFKGGKNKKKKLSEAPSGERMGKSIKTDVKKYFLGICPSEIDKGRKEGQDESGSDSEPLISLVINQNKSEETITKREEVTEPERKENRDSSLVLVKKLKKKKVAKKRKALPNIIFTCGEKEEERESKPREIQVNPPERERDFIRQIKKKIKTGKNKKKVPKNTHKGLRMTVTLKEPTLKIIDRPVSFPTENKWTVKPAETKVEVESRVEPQTTPEDFPPKSIIETVMPERRSRRISKETKSTSEFVIDDPLLLVDELWSDLDSDSDSSKKKSKKAKKKSPKKKTSEEKRISDVNLEELLRNFGEKKEDSCKKLSSSVKIVRKTGRKSRSTAEIRKAMENRKVHESYRRLSLKLFRFNKSKINFGNRGERLSDAKKALKKKLDMMQEKSTSLPDLPFLAAEFKENPVQVIQCGGQKSKPAKRGHKRVDSKGQDSNIHLKISLPLESIDNMAILNNNHLTELVVEEAKVCPPVCWEQHAAENEISRVEAPPEKETIPIQGMSTPAEPIEATELKIKTKRSEVIDKIFYCEICKTYYYSCSQLKIHKLSNRHKLKESELLQTQQAPVQEDIVKSEISTQVPVEEPVTAVEDSRQGSSSFETIEAEKLNEDTLEMPTLEGPFIENRLTRVEPPQPPPQPPVVSSFGFSQESLKDIQRAIGCTDEEMLILTLLGENTIEIENDILDLDSCKSNQSKGQRDKGDGSLKDNEKSNGALKVDLKQRMTSALACLVNKAVFNLLQKYETAAKSAVNPEALSLLGKLSSLSRRKNILQLNELLKKQNDGESSISTAPKDFEKKEPTVSYKYQCTICGSRFEKASTRECHISRSHKGKAKKVADDSQTLPSASEDDWNDSWNYDAIDDHPGSTTAFQFWCSDCGINFQSPQEVLEHQKLEHQAGLKEPEQAKDSGPLQSSTIGSSDEIMEGKKTKRRPKLFSSEELDQQRIIANNELRKLDRKFSNKSKSGKIKWGMDALRFTVEKENKMVMVEEEKEIVPEEPVKPPVDIKNIDLVPKLNLSRTSNIPEFKVIQKNSLKSRFQKIIDNKLKRRTACPSQQEAETEELETEVMLVPVVVKKKNKKQKLNKYTAKKEEADKPVDVYDFNESESEGEPVVYSHIKKPTPSPTKLRLVKVKEGPSKNKADSTTKDLAPDDYDSEDSLPLSVVKKSKPGEDEDEKEEKMSEDGVEKSEGILEQVEYLIEQLENETGSAKNESISKENEMDNLEYRVSKEEAKEDSVDSALTAEEAQDSLRVSVANEFLELDDLPLKNQKPDKNDEKFETMMDEEREEKPPQEIGGILAEPESSQSTFDEEDSIPLLLMSKKAEETRFVQEEKKCDENITDVSTTASEDVQLFRPEETKSNDPQNSIISQPVMEESLPPVFSSSENEGGFSEKSNKPFESLNGNVIYCRNDSMSDFGTDFSNDGIIDSNFEKRDLQEPNKSFIKEVTEKEDVVIVCSKGIEESEESKGDRKRLKSGQKKKKGNLDTVRRKKKRFPLLTATIEENNFRKSESPKLNKEVIVRKIWQRRKLTEDSSDDEESFTSMDNENSMENIQNDESQTEIEKEIIVKRIWSRKKLDHEEEFGEKLEEKFEDIKINQTEISDEIVIKCGPKAKTSPKRRKSRSSTNESSKETIMRKIWSGRCTFQTKAALKTYDSDMIPNCKENEIAESQTKPKKRGRPSGFSPSKRSKTEGDLNKDDEDDLDSLLEEIEREQLEKAIRSEFLQLRRSDKANVEMKDGSNPTVGLFAETSLKHKKEISERKRRKVKKKIKHPRQSLLKRKKYIKRPIRRVLPNEERIFSESTNRTNSDPPSEQPENSIEKNNTAFSAEGKMKIRKHKKHRHKHHHHKHKHKKSKHHKSIVSKHKSKHRFESGEEESVVGNGEDSFTILEKICQDIPNQIESETHFQSGGSKGLDTDANSSDSKAEDTMSSFSFENKTEEYPEFQVEVPGKERFESENGNGNIYEFVEDVPDFTEDGLKNLKM